MKRMTDFVMESPKREKDTQEMVDGTLEVRKCRCNLLVPALFDFWWQKNFFRWKVTEVRTTTNMGDICTSTNMTQTKISSYPQP